VEAHSRPRRRQMDRAAVDSTCLSRWPARRGRLGALDRPRGDWTGSHAIRHVVFENGRAGVAALRTTISSTPRARARTRTPRAPTRHTVLLDRKVGHLELHGWQSRPVGIRPAAGLWLKRSSIQTRPARSPSGPSPSRFVGESMREITSSSSRPSFTERRRFDPLPDRLGAASLPAVTPYIMSTWQVLMESR
jgi:hypothetical protein